MVMTPVMISFILLSWIASGLAELLELNQDNFGRYVNGSTNIILEFSAPWCGTCQYILKPEWKIAAETFQHIDDITFVTVDGSLNGDLVTKYDIQRYPTIIFFPKGSMDPEEYEGQRTADGLVKWINNRIGTSRIVESTVMKLTSENFDMVVSGPRAVFLRFYAGYSGHCKKLSYSFREIGKIYGDDTEVIFAEVHGPDEVELVSKYEIKGYPTIMFFPAGTSTPELYRGNREVGAFVDFLNARVSSQRNMDGSLKRTEARFEAKESSIMRNISQRAAIYDDL